MTNEEIAIRAWLSKPYPYSDACCCLGPQGKEPVCPCAMGFVEIVEGRYYQIYEHRSPEGVTHIAKEIFSSGDRGNPYDNMISYEASIEAKKELERNMTLKERLQKKWGKS